MLTPKSADDGQRRESSMETTAESEGDSIEAVSDAESNPKPGPSSSAKPFQFLEDRLILQFIVTRDKFREAVTPGDNTPLWREIQDKVLKSRNSRNQLYLPITWLNGTNWIIFLDLQVIIAQAMPSKTDSTLIFSRISSRQNFV